MHVLGTLSRAAMLCAAAVLLSAAASASAKTLTLDDTYKIVGFGSPRISPDGSKLLFTRAHVNVETDHRDTVLVLYDLRSGTQRVLTSGRTRVGDPRWSPDGSRISFISSDAKHRSQVFVLPMDGGEAIAMTAAPEGVQTYAWRPDGAAIAFETSDSAPERKGVARFEDSYRVTNNAFLAVGPFLPTHVWLATRSVRDGNVEWTSRRLTHGSFSADGGGLSFSHDGKTLAFVRLPSSIPGDDDRSAIELLDVATGATHGLTGRTANEYNPQFSPNGKYIAYAYSRDGDPNNEAEIYLSDGHGPGHMISTTLDRNAGNFAWYPDSSALLIGTNDGTQKTLYRLALDGRVHRFDFPGMDAFGDFTGSIARDGALAFVGATPQHLGEEYYLAANAATPKRLTDGNAWTAGIALGANRTVNWTGSAPQHFHEDGVVTYPPDYDALKKAGKSLPLVLLIHGGPTSATTISFDVLAQLIASHGYIVLQPNYRGSDNLGNAYQRAVFRDPVEGPASDIMAGVASVEAHDPIDRSRVCVSGWSYGGLMTSWLLTHDNAWACAVSGAAVDDQVWDTVLADDINVNEYSMWGPPFANQQSLDLYRKASPITYYRNVHAPTLILDDTYDVRVPEPESYAFFHALQDAGKTVEFYQWPIAAHFPGDPVRQADVYRHWIAWLVKYLH